MFLKNLFLNYIKQNAAISALYLLMIFMTTPLETIIFSYYLGILFPMFEKFKKNRDRIIKTMITIVILYAITRAASSARDYIEMIYVPNFNKYVREFIFDHILDKYKVFFDVPRSGEIISRINSIPWLLRSIVVEGLNFVLPPIMIVVVALTLVFTYNLTMGATMLTAFLLTGFNVAYFMKQCMKEYNLTADIYYNMSEHLEDKMNNLFEIYTNNQEIDEMTKNAKKETEYAKQFIKSKGCVFKTNMFNAIISSGLVLTFVCLAYYKFKKKQIKLEHMITMFICLTYYIESSRNFGDEFPFFANNLGRLENSNKFIRSIIRKNELKSQSEVPHISLNKNYVPEQNKSAMMDAIDKNDPTKKHLAPLSHVKGHIEFKNVTFGYDKAMPIIRNLTFKTQPGKMTLLWGESGKGKSTIAKLILGFYDVRHGKIEVDGKNMKDVNKTDYRRYATYVSQNTKLFNDTILQNMRYGNNASEKDIIDFVQRYRIDYIFKNVKNGLYTNVGAGGNHLSGGQKQIILVVRAILSGKTIIVFDEPTSALDSKGVGILLNLVKKMKNQKNMIFITHDKRIPKSMFDQTVVL